MGVRQKLILMLYALTVFIFSFVYVPYVRSWQGGTTYVGHHLRATFSTFLGMKWEFGTQDTAGNLISISIDSSLMIAEIIALTAIAGAGLLFFKKRTE